MFPAKITSLILIFAKEKSGPAFLLNFPKSKISKGFPSESLKSIFEKILYPQILKQIFVHGFLFLFHANAQSFFAKNTDFYKLFTIL
jgi:hypothetical protein